MRLIVSIGIAFSFFSASLFANGHRISVLTYNVGLLKVAGVGDIVKHVDDRANELPSQISEFIRVKPADIILFQELWDKPPAEAIEKVLRRDYAVYRPNENTWAAKGSGLLLAIRKESLTVKSTKFSSFDVKHGAEAATNKGWIEAVVETKIDAPVPIHLIGTHLQCITVTHEGVPTKRGEIAAHKSQIEQIAKTLDDAPPYLILGDMNVGPTLGESVYKNMLHRWKVKNLASLMKLLSTWDPKNVLVEEGGFSNDPPAHVDACYVRESGALAFELHNEERVFTELLKDRNYPLSDHYGYFVEFDLVTKELQK